MVKCQVVSIIIKPSVVMVLETLCEVSCCYGKATLFLLVISAHRCICIPLDQIVKVTVVFSEGTSQIYVKLSMSSDAAQNNEI